MTCIKFDMVLITIINKKPDIKIRGTFQYKSNLYIFHHYKSTVNSILINVI